MPHFIIDCSPNILDQHPPETILEAVYNAAEETGLFRKGDVKVRLQPFAHYKLGEGKSAFIHVFAHIMQGRTTEQKASLSRNVVAALNRLFPDIPILSMNVRDFEKATYFNKTML